MAIAADASSGQYTIASGANSGSFNHTCSGTDRLLFVTGTLYGSAAGLALTYNGSAMTQVKSANNAVSGITEVIYCIVAPSTGTNAIAISYTTNGASRWEAKSYTGAQQSTTMVASGTNTGSGTAISVSCDTTGTADCWRVAGIGTSSSRPISQSTNFTSFPSDGLFGSSGGDNGPQATGGSLTMNATQSSAYNWAGAVVAFGPVTATASQDVAGTITPAGTVTLQVTGITITGTITPAGAVSNDGGSSSPGPVSVAGTITPVGEPATITVGFADGTMVGTITPAGALSNQQLSFSGSFEGTIEPTGQVSTDQQGKGVAGTLTPVGALNVPTAIAHGLAGTITPAGDVTPTLYVGVTLILHSNTGSD